MTWDSCPLNWSLSAKYEAPCNKKSLAPRTLSIALSREDPVAVIFKLTIEVPAVYRPAVEAKSLISALLMP